jgi:UDP-glucose 4-epimerase
MRVLITGGAGFIGSHLADAILARRDEVILLDNFSTGTDDNIDHLRGKIKIINGDIRDVNLVEHETANADLVFHMAAALGVNTILESPLESLSTNITGSEVVLRAAAKHHRRIIIASTSEIYGKNPKQPLNETDDRVVGSPQKIRWSYSDAKAVEEAMAFAMHSQLDLPVTTVRLFNTVGPRQTGRYGMVVPRFVESAINGKPLVVYGDGSQSRVFCHVSDAIEAMLALAENKNTIGEVYNVGGTGEITMTDLAGQIIAQLHSKSSIEYLPYAKAYPAGFEDMQRRVPDTSKIAATIGWKPSRDLTQIVTDVAASISRK